MKWVLIIWLGTQNNYTVYESFETSEQCFQKKDLVTKALQQVESKMNLTCRQQRPADKFNKSNIAVNRYVLQ